MFVLLVTVFAAVHVISGGPINDPQPRYVEMPGGDGSMHAVDLAEEPDWQLLEEVSRNPANNQYILFTRRNPDSGQILHINDAQSIKSSNFNPNIPTVVIAHGWLSNQETDINPLIRDAYLSKTNVNVIVLDWRRLAYSGYVTAATGVPAVGRGLGLFLEFLSSVTGAPYENMHLVGFSLGAHLVGNAGRFLRSRVARITGLDPAGPLWNYNSNRLSAADAIYVEVIHTDGGVVGLGIGSNLGHADFYPNGGNSQPGCLTSICDHNRAWQLFAATVSHNHLIGTECLTSLQVTMNSCRGTRTLPMGNGDLRKSGSGTYRVNTGRRYPF